jgi:hypothetical protein
MMFETSSPTASEAQPLRPPGSEKQDDGEECDGPLLPPLTTTTTTTRRRRRGHHKIAEDLEHQHHRTKTTLLTKKTESKEKNNAEVMMTTTKTKNTMKKMRGSYEENDGDAMMMMQSDVEHQKSHSVLLEHAKELKENFQRWIHAIMERKDIAGMHRESLYDAPPPRPPPAMMTKTTTRKKEDLQRRDQECRQQNSAPKGALNENNNQGGGVGPLSLPRFKFLKLLSAIDKIAWDPRLKSFVIYFLCVLMLETKITIVGVKQIGPDENRFLTPEMYTVYVKNILTTFVPLQFAIDLTFLSLGVRKRIGARGKFEYDAEYEEKVYFWRQMIKTFLRHPQVTMVLAGLYGPVSHEFSSVQFGAIVFIPLIIGKYTISRYSSLKYSFFYSIMATVYAFLFQFSAPEVREMWFENKFETYMDVTAKMYSRCSPQYMALIFFTPLVMHLMYLVVNATGTSKKYINLSLATTAIVYGREKSRFDRVRFIDDEQNAEKEEVLEEEEEEEEEQQHQQNKLSLLHVFNENKARLTALFVVMLTTIGFWAAYEQAGNALSIFIDERVSRDGVPTAAFQSINPGMILALTPVINRYWKYQSETNREPDQVMKMAIGCCLLGLANVLLAFASTNLPSGAVAEADLPPGMKLNQFWIWLYFLVATAGELYVSPVGLSFVTTAAPKEIVGFACGCWFLSAFFGNYLAGEIGSMYASAKPFAFWSAVGVLSVSVGVALALARNKIVHALKEEEEEEQQEETDSRSRGSKRRRKRRNTTRDERDASGGSNNAL